jgi:benzoate/toluate 1,2-dioxygenase beta subunit
MSANLIKNAGVAMAHGEILGDRTAIELFLIQEAMLLDDRRFEEWRELFTEDGYYWVPLKPEHTDPGAQAALFYDDRQMMETRIERLRHPHIHAQMPPHRTCHVIGNVIVTEFDASLGECTVRSTLIMSDHRLRTQRIFSARVHHRLRLVDDTLHIVWKRVDLLNCDDPHELVAIPF